MLLKIQQVEATDGRLYRESSGWLLTLTSKNVVATNYLVTIVIPRDDLTYAGDETPTVAEFHRVHRCEHADEITQRYTRKKPIEL